MDGDGVPWTYRHKKTRQVSGLIVSAGRLWALAEQVLVRLSESNFKGKQLSVNDFFTLTKQKHPFLYPQKQWMPMYIHGQSHTQLRVSR